MKCFGFIPVYMSSIIIAIFNIVFGFSDLIYMIHAYSKLDNLGKRFHLSFFDIQCPDEWAISLSRQGEHADPIFFKLASECVNRKIVLHSLIKEDQTGLQIIVPNTLVGDNPVINMLYFNETRFGVGHFQVQQKF